MEFLESDLKVEDSSAHIRRYFFGIVRRWPFILAFLVISVLVIVAFNRYSTPVYLVQARITTSKFAQNRYSPVPGLVDANFFLKGYTDVLEEIPLLKSMERIEAAVSRIDYHVSYFSKGIIKTVERAKGAGFMVDVDTIPSHGFPAGIPIYINKQDQNSFRLSVDDEKWNSLNTQLYQYGEQIKLGTAVIRIRNTNGHSPNASTVYFTLNQKSAMANNFRSRLAIQWSQQGSSMLDISMESEIPERDVAFLNAFYDVTTLMGIRDKNENLDNTIQFIEEQMNIIEDSVLFYQGLVDNLKLKNLKLNLGTDYIFNKFTDLDQRKAEIAMKESYLRYLEEYFKDNKRSDQVFAPSVMELDVPLLEDWVTRYIEERLGEQVMLTKENAMNPLVIREDSVRRKLVGGIFESIASTRVRNKEALKEIDHEANILYSSVKDVQMDFRELTEFERLLQLNVSLFDLFLKRKTEAAISKASATSDYKIIDKPYFSLKPLRPNKLMNLMWGGLLGLVLPICFFLIRDITNPRILDKEEFQDIIQMPLLGSIPHSPYAALPTISDHPRSVVAEAFRAIRANLKFITPPNGGCTTLLVTSSVAGEGKTFCSLNLAQSLVMARKKTLLIGADMRKPNIKKYIDIGHEHGLSEFLAGMISYDELITHGQSQLPDVINAGTIPPNPAELLVNPRMGELMNRLKNEYEYIILDTSPIGLVSDAVELLKYTDFNLFVVRQNVTHKGALRMISEIYEEGKIKNFTIIFNDVNIRRSFGKYTGYVYGMGYSGYGYGYYEEDNSKKS